MSKLLRIGFIILVLIASVTTHNTWAQGLTDIIGNKSFWTSYEWQEIFEDSDFYRLAVWEKSAEKGRILSATHLNSPVEKYTTRGSIDNLNIEQQISISVFGEPPRTIFHLEYTSSSEINNVDYDKLVSWCNENFGKPFHSRVDKIEENYTQVKETHVTTWVIGNTIIGVTTSPSANKPTSLETRLFFEHMGKTPAGITKPVDQPISQPVRATSVPAIKATSKNRLPTPTDNNEIKSISDTMYMQPPYIWEDESGVTQVTNDILDIPEGKRALFEINVQK